MLKVYITDLAAYNSGALVGEWVSLPMEEEELSLKIKSILKAGEAECGNYEEHKEYFITDYEFDETEFKFIEVGEYSNPFELNETCEEFSTYEEDDLKRISYLVENVGFYLEDAKDRYEDVYIYENTTLLEVVEQYIEDTVDFSTLPDIITLNIDYESIKIDFEISGEYEAIDNDIYHFVN